MELGIVGYGVVGHALAGLFGGEHEIHQLVIYDKFKSGWDAPARRAQVNRCELVFVAVPTPPAPDGSADLSAVDEVVAWVEAPICIKSTVPPGTTDRLSHKYQKSLCFSPEYVGETPWHPFKSIENHGFVIVGGPRERAQRVLEAYQQILGPAPRYWLTDRKTAEMAKYMENCFYATKVAFANQFHSLAVALGVDFTELRELWLQDDRVGRSHSLVTEEHGFGGRCLPKDLAAMIALARHFGGAPLLEAVQEFNRSSRERRPPAEPRPAAAVNGAEAANGAETENGREPARAA